MRSVKGLGGGGVLAVAALSALVAAGCGATTTRGNSGRAVQVLYEPAPPAQLRGLDVQPEDISDQVRGIDQQYTKATAMYSLRAGELVAATLQISRFVAKARLDDEKFRDGIITDLGGTKGIPSRVGSDTVYITQGRKQQVAAWIRGHDLFILTTREDYSEPRGLLRAALEVGR